MSAWYGTALASAGYRQSSITNPAEDGSVTGEYDGSGLGSGCRAQLTYKPQGTQTFILALISASCPAS